MAHRVRGAQEEFASLDTSMTAPRHALLLLILCHARSLIRYGRRLPDWRLPSCVEVLCTTPHIYEQKTAQTMATSWTCLSTTR